MKQPSVLIQMLIIIIKSVVLFHSVKLPFIFQHQLLVFTNSNIYPTISSLHVNVVDTDIFSTNLDFNTH